ncbi:MAG: hypothetical protein LQ339_007687 [Xanthoria mediterranea]|nr:MAG: hypothetical protein LQ339_007687 [Xanthoria mediterranea]
MNTPSKPPTSKLGFILLELSWALFGISTLILGLRLFSDLYYMRTFKLPSFFTLLGLLLGLAGQILITYSVHWGLGKHIESLQLTQIEMTMTYIWNAQPLQLLANTSGKLAIATLLVTLHGPKFAKAKSIFIWTLAAVQSTTVIIAISMIYAQCDPVEKLWKVSLPGACNGRERNEKWAYVQGAISSSVDLALAVYPIVLFWDLQIQMLKKLVLSVLFAFGIVACICCIVRTVNISRLGQTSDLTHEVAELVIWNTAEMYLVLIAGSLPGLRPLCNKRVRALSNRQSSYGYHSRDSHMAHKRDFAMKLSNLPHGRTKAFASTSNNNRSQESTENFFANMSNGHIMKTTEFNVVHGDSSSRGETPFGQEDERGVEQGKASRGSAGSDLEIGRIRT